VAAATVAFDIIGTLFSLDAPRRVISAYGGPPATFDVWFSSALRDYFARSHSGSYTPLKDVLEDTVERTAYVVGWEIDADVASELMGSMRELTPVDGAEAALTALGNQGWKRLAVTNSSRDLVEALLDRGGLTSHFDGVITCDDLGVSKPHPHVYEEVKRQSQGEAWLVAAHAWDVGGALGAGLHAIWISTGEHVYPKFLPGPDMIAGDLGSAVEFLGTTA
jgi:2-haloacid dehalogenase